MDIRPLTSLAPDRHAVVATCTLCGDTDRIVGVVPKIGFACVACAEASPVALAARILRRVVVLQKEGELLLRLAQATIAEVASPLHHTIH